MSSLWAVGLLLAGTGAGICTESGRPPRFVESWDGLTPGPGWFSNPVSLAAEPGGSFLLGAGEARLVRLDETGEILHVYELPSPPAGAPLLVLAVAADEGFVYVNAPPLGVLQFTSSGRLHDTLAFRSPVNGLAVDPVGNLYLSGSRLLDPGEAAVPGDRGPAIWKLNPRGDVLAHWNVPADGPIAAAPDGSIWGVTRAYEDGPRVLRRWTPFGEVLSDWDLSDVPHREIGGVAVDARGHAFLTVPKCGLAVEYDRQGRAVRRWSETGPGGPPLSQPSGIAVDAHGRLYIADWARSRIVKYDLRRSR